MSRWRYSMAAVYLSLDAFAATGSISVLEDPSGLVTRPFCLRPSPVPPENSCR